MTIDFSKILPKSQEDETIYAIHMPTKDDASFFLNEMKEHYPDRVANWHFASFSYGEHTHGGVYYIPHFEIQRWFPGSVDTSTMTHANGDSLRRIGKYTMVELCDIIMEKVELPIQQSDKELEFLFEM